MTMCSFLESGLVEPRQHRESPVSLPLACPLVCWLNRSERDRAKSSLQWQSLQRGTLGWRGPRMVPQAAEWPAMVSLANHESSEHHTTVFLFLTIFRTLSAVPTGTVLFSTMIAPGFAYLATSRIAPSKAVVFVARPAPTPNILVGVLTDMKITSAWLIALADSQVKYKFCWRRDVVESAVTWAPSRTIRTTASRPGS